MEMNEIEARIRRVLPDVSAVAPPDRYGAVGFVWRHHELCLRSDGYVEAKGRFGSADVAALVERMLDLL